MEVRDFGFGFMAGRPCWKLRILGLDFGWKDLLEVRDFRLGFRLEEYVGS